MMDVQSFAGIPAFLIYFCVSGVLIAAYVFVYTWITPHDEFALIRSNVPGAAVSLGLSTVGFALPLTSAISHSSGILDLAIWGVIALIVQVVVYYLARIPLPDLSQRIAAGEMGPAIWLGLASVTGGLINAASMSM
jgi:putative membrane protein